MARKRARQELDGRPLHGYGVLLESDEGRIANSDIAVWGLTLAPILAAAGVAFLVDKDPEISRLWYVGLLLLIFGATYFATSVFLTVRGMRRWRRNRAAERAAFAAAEGNPVPVITIRDRKRY